MLIVQKFGGSSVANAERVRHVAGIIADNYSEGHDIVVVLSAQGDTTDDLIEKARELNPRPSKREMDVLLSTGEQQSVALMAMAFDTMDIPAVSLNAFQIAMHTTRVHGNARLKRIDTDRIMHELEHRRIVIVTGFQGVNKYDNYTTLGRGGSDTTAVALAAALHRYGFRVQAVYAAHWKETDAADRAWLEERLPGLRVLCSERYEDVLIRELPRDCMAVGFDSAYLLRARHFVDIQRDEGLFGYHGIRREKKL